MRIQELFAADVTRDIPPVVYFHEQSPPKLLSEVSEYIITGGYPEGDPRARRVQSGIHEQLVHLLRALTRELDKKGGPELPASWISGFYGSGKSSFAKLLGLALDGARLPDGSPLSAALLARDIFADEKFRQHVRSRPRWIVSPDEPFVTVNAEDVVHSVLDADFDPIHFFSQLNVCANATTNICPNRISIDATRVEQWTSTSSTIRADYLNTLAHEISHLATTNAGCDCASTPACLIRYLDRGHDACTERYLVSYQLGDMVECHLLSADDDAFATCMRLRRKLTDEGEIACAERMRASSSASASTSESP